MQTQSHSFVVGGALAAALLAAPLALADAIAQWHFDEAPGSRTAYDSIGNHHGTLFGSADFVPGGISGNAINIAKAGNGLVSMGNYFAFTSANFTITAWVQTLVGDRTLYVFLGKHYYGSANGYVLALNTTGAYGLVDKAWFAASGSAGQEVNSTTTVNDGVWHQVVATYRAGGKMKIYVDGAPTEDSKASTPVGGNSSPFVIGGHDGPSGPYNIFNGRVDEVQLYNHLLTDRQIQYLFEHAGDTVIGPLGDLNCDLVVNNFDIDPFVLALVDPAGYAKQFPNCRRILADVNGDGEINNFDIDPFVKLLTGG